MLVLTRKLEESIIIGDEITIKVLEIKGDKIKLGIKAPRGMNILRQEIYEEVQKENILATEAFNNIDRLAEGLKIEKNKNNSNDDNMKRRERHEGK